MKEKDPIKMLNRYSRGEASREEVMRSLGIDYFQLLDLLAKHKIDRPKVPEDVAKEMVENMQKVLPERETTLRAEFPSLFAGMRREVGCEDGWFDLIRELSLQMIEIEKATGIKIEVKQVKEKFGELRYYAIPDIENINPGLDGEHWRRIISSAINQASIRSTHVCEICGQHGEIRSITRANSTRMWTLCAEHYEEARKR